MAGIYIHIPFCKQACNYCNFYFSTSLGNKQKFIAALLKEIEMSKEYLENEKIETIYIGGGTPTQLQFTELEKIVDKLHKHHLLNGVTEFTIEANPDDLHNTQDIKALGRLGINRFSVGVQSFFDEDLQYMNRAHNAGEAHAAILRVQDAGFENITLDLIYGSPTTSDIRWRENLATAFALNVPHISAYGLTIEPKTALERKIKKGQAKPVDEEQAARQFTILINQMSQHHFEQYEISNFARHGKYAQHNTNYWLGKKYLGLGPSAHSYNGAARRWNVANNINYIQRVMEGNIPFEEEVLSPAQIVNEKIMTSLRTQWGLAVFDFETGVAGKIHASLKNINPLYYTFKEGILKLTDTGKLFADAVAATLFIEE